MKKLVVVALFVALGGCATAINRHNAENYHQAGLQAEWNGDYELAERNFYRALVNARSGNSPKAGISMAEYNLGRIKGYLCKHKEAEELLLDALKLEVEVTGPESGVTSKRLFELARLYYDQGKYDKAAQYYSRAIPIVKKLGVEKSDPIALADAMDEYSVSLSKSGNKTKASEVKSEASALRKNNPGAKAKFVPTRYNTRC